MNDQQKAAAEFYAKASPREAMRRALRKHRVPLSAIAPSKPKAAKKPAR